MCCETDDDRASRDCFENFFYECLIVICDDIEHLEEKTAVCFGKGFCWVAKIVYEGLSSDVVLFEESFNE